MDDIQQQITNKIDQLVDKLKSFRNLSKELEQRLSENKLKVDYLETRQAELEQEVENKKRITLHILNQQVYRNTL